MRLQLREDREHQWNASWSSALDSFQEMVSSTPASLTKRAATLRQVAEGVQDEDVHQLLTDLANECDALAKAQRPPPDDSERRRPGRVEYQNPELITLLRSWSETNKLDAAEERALATDRQLLRAATIGLIMWGVVLSCSFFLWLRTVLSASWQ